MTNNQIGYMNALTQKANLAIAQQQADAATLQAATTKRKVDFDTTTGYTTNLVTGGLSTLGGLLALAFL